MSFINKVRSLSMLILISLLLIACGSTSTPVEKFEAEMPIQTWTAGLGMLAEGDQITRSTNLRFYQDGTEVNSEQVEANKWFAWEKINPDAESALFINTDGEGSSLSLMNYAKASIDPTQTCPSWAVDLFGQTCDSFESQIK